MGRELNIYIQGRSVVIVHCHSVHCHDLNSPLSQSMNYVYKNDTNFSKSSSSQIIEV